jgi:hypothetical protein
MDNGALALLVIPPLLACAMTVVAAVQMMVPRHCWRTVTCLRNNNGNNGGNGVDDGALALLAIPACLLDNNNSRSGSADNGALALLAVPPLLAHATTTAAAVRMMVPWHCWRSVACSRDEDNNNGGDGMDHGALALSAIPACLLDNDDSNGSGAKDGALSLLAVPPLLALATTAAVVVQMMVSWHCQQSVACLHDDDNNDDGGDGIDDKALESLAIPAHLLNKDNSNGSGVDNGALASMAVSCLLMQ